MIGRIVQMTAAEKVLGRTSRTNSTVLSRSGNVPT